MVVLENSVVLARTSEEVFDYLSDLRSELEWNPKMTSASLLTDEPIGVGSRYRAKWVGSPANLIEYVSYERPHSWVATSTSRMMDLRFSADIEPVVEGARLRVRMEILPHGPARLLSPLLGRWMQAQEVENMSKIKKAVESR